MNFLRKLHLIVGATLAPFLLVTGITGFLILTGHFHATTFGLHSWRLVWRFIGMASGLGLALLALTGATLYVNMRVNQFRRWRKKRQARG
jgi:hypothetical protein